MNAIKSTLNFAMDGSGTIARESDVKTSAEDLLASNSVTGTVYYVKNNKSDNNISRKYITDGGKKYILYGPFNWEFNLTISSLTLFNGNNEVKKIDSSSGNVIAKYDSDSNTYTYGDIGTIESKKSFYIKIDPAEVASFNKIKISSSSKNAGVEMWLLEKTDRQNVIVYNKINTSVSKTITYSIQKGNLTIKKVDENGNALNGAVFQILSTDGTVIKDNVKIENDGQVTVQNLPIGTVKVKEIKAPTNYNISTEQKKVTIKANETVEVTFTNTIKKGNLIIKKVDENGNALNGAKFQVLSTTGTVIEDNIEVKSNGQVEVKDLLPGNVKVKEIEAPTNYNMKTELQTVEIKSGETVTVTFVNEIKKGDLIIKKVDENGNALNGAKFQVLSTTGTVIKDNVKVESNGQVKVTGIPIGQVKVKEIEAPTNYNMKTELQTAEIKEGKTAIVTFVNERKTGSLRIIKKDSKDNSVLLKGAVFNIKSEDGTFNKDVTVNGDTTIEEIPTGKVTVTEKSAPSNYKIDATQNVTVEVKENKTTKAEFTDTLKTGNIEFIKVVKDNNNVVLEEFKFRIEPIEILLPNGLSETDINKIYTAYKVTREFTTDSSGKAKEENLPLGRYKITEISTGTNEYFDPDETYEVTITEDGETIKKTMENDPDYVDISGYVWEDGISGKQDERNNLYDNGEKRLSGIHVVLKIGTKTVTNKNGQKMETDTQGDKGEYKFSLIPIEIINDPDCTIEFTYDGLTYEAVDYNISKEITNASRAKENENLRNETNRKYSTESPENMVPNFDMTANTKDARCELSNYIEVVKDGDVKVQVNNMNLGLRQREQPDMAILKDVWNAQVSINNKIYTYNYADRYDMLDASKEKSDFKVKFEDKYTGVYCQPIYLSDVNYEGSNELKVYVTYKIAIKNEATSLKAKVNSIVDYYDSDYQIIAVGTGINEKSQITGNLSAQQNSATYNFDGKKYKKVTITPSQEIIDSQKMLKDSIYIQFELSRETIKTIMSENKEGLDNIVEIYSQTTYDANGNPYAGKDKDSTPGNYEQKQDEDDNDKAPLFKLVDAGDRTTTGTVFIDDEGTSADINPGQERLGNGEYNESTEKGLPGVLVTLNEISGSGQTYTGETDSNGNFSVAGFIPGDYTMTYTWGGQTYNNGSENIKITVQDYKGTIYKNKDRQNNTRWYREVNPRYSDALDNYERRKEIDGNNTEINFKTDFGSSDSKMDSTTPKMVFDIENTDSNSSKVDLNNEVNTPNYVVEKIDFGIVERPRQQIIADKTATNLQLSLTNGQQIIDATIDENGNISGQRTGLTAEPGVNGQNGFMKIEIDNELLQGSTLKMKYKITATNNSELDYITPEYYLYGEKPADNSKLSTLAPLGIMDYLDENWDFDGQNNTAGEWVEVKDTQLTDLIENPNETSVKSKTKLYSQKLSGNVLLPKNTSNNNENNSADLDLVVSKYLSIQDEIVLANDVEIINVGTNTGRKLYNETPGNYVPAKETTYEEDDDRAEPVTVTPHTGGNGMEGIQKAAIGIGILIVLGIGIVFIKKKVLG